MGKHFGKKIIHVSAFLLIFISYSCVSTKLLLIEIPQKGKKDLPADIQSVLLVSRVVDENYTNLLADSLQKLFYEHRFNCDTLIKDRQAVDTTLKALGDLMFESGRYDIVIPENRFLDFNKNAFLTTEMDWDEAKDLCETYHTNAIISIDYFKTKVSTSFKSQDYFSKVEAVFFNMWQAKMSVGYEALFRIYDPYKEKILMRQFMSDTIVWEDTDAEIGELFSRFTPVKNALTEAGIALALDFSEKISTSWFKEKRYYFIKGDAKMKQAEQLVNANQWEPAIAMWKDIAENAKSKSVKSKAEFNIALGYEMLDDIDQAIQWALQSFKTMYRTNTYEYLETLNLRKIDISKQ